MMSFRIIFIISLFVLIDLNTSPAINKQPSSEVILNQIKKDLSLNSAKDINGKYVQKLNNNINVEYTIIPPLQNNLNAYLKNFNLPYAAFVAIEPKTGKIMAMVDSSTYSNKSGFVTLSSKFPSASIFKIISSTALLEKSKVSPNTVTCYHGGSNILLKHNIIDNKRRDKHCVSFKNAFAHSINAVIGKLTINNINTDVLLNMANFFKFNEKIDFLWNISKSTLKKPKSTLSLARTAAGFINSTLSPIHAALIGAAIASGGIWLDPMIVQKITMNQKEYLFDFPESNNNESHLNNKNSFLSTKTLKNLKKMMIQTTVSGTASRYFKDRSAQLQGIDIAVKTGSLSMPSNSNFHTSWMVGFAPADHPKIAFASLVVNKKGKWKIKSGQLTRKALELFFSIQ